MTLFQRVENLDVARSGDDVVGVNPDHVAVAGIEKRADGKFWPWVEMCSGFRVELSEENSNADARASLEQFLVDAGHGLEASE